MIEIREFFLYVIQTKTCESYPPDAKRILLSFSRGFG